MVVVPALPLAFASTIVGNTLLLSFTKLRELPAMIRFWPFVEDELFVKLSLFSINPAPRLFVVLMALPRGEVKLSTLSKLLTGVPPVQVAVLQLVVPFEP